MKAEHATYYAGQMRWSNRMAGLEFAPLDSDIGGDARRLRRQRPGGIDQSPGVLLQDALERDGYGEGCGVIVIALPKRMRDGEIQAAVERVRDLVGPHEEELPGV